MHSLELTNINKSRVYRPAMNTWSNDQQRFHLPDIRPIVPIKSGRASLSQPLHYISVGGHPGVTSVQDGILADNDQNFSCGWDSPDTKFQLLHRPENHVPLTLYVVILF